MLAHGGVIIVPTLPPYVPKLHRTGEKLGDLRFICIPSGVLGERWYALLEVSRYISVVGHCVLQSWNFAPSIQELSGICSELRKTIAVTISCTGE